MHKLQVGLGLLLAIFSGVTTVSANQQDGSDTQCSLPPYGGDKVALVVGTDDYSVYQYAKIPNLKNAVNDARTVADLLSKQGFVVRCLLNPTQMTFSDEKIRLALFLKQQKLNDPQVADGGRAVIYIAGHGYRDPESNEDYLLFRFEADETKYSKVVNLTTLDGRIAEGRWSVQSLTQSFNTAIQGVMFVLDACRSVVEIPSASGGAPIRAGPMQQLARDLMKGNQVVAYSTQPGGVAADDVPNSSEKNGLYASALSNFINLPIFSLGHALDLTGAVVKVNKEDQVPIYSVSAGTFFLSNPWVNNEPADICEMVNSEIWNAAGRHCAQLKQASCIMKDICPVVTPHLNGSEAPQAIACLAQQKEKWLHNDLIGICTRNEEQKSAGGRTPASTSASAAGLPGSKQSDQHPAIAASVTAPIAFSVNGKKSEAYNVVASTQSDLSSIDFATLALSGWANKTTSLPLASERLTNEEFAANQSELDRTLAKLNPAKKSTFTDKQRDLLVVKTADGNVPAASQPSPFKADLTGRSITLRNLPAANAAAIGTFTGDNSSAEIDCYSIPCIGNWIGLRVKQGSAVYRGWASADELRSIAKPAVAIEVEYDGKRIAPNTTTVDAIRRAIRADPTKPPVSGRVHVMALRSGTDGEGSFLASARLSYLDRVIIELGINPDDIDETVIDLPSGYSLPAAIVNLGSPSPK